MHFTVTSTEYKLPNGMKEVQGPKLGVFLSHQGLGRGNEQGLVSMQFTVFLVNMSCLIEKPICQSMPCD